MTGLLGPARRCCASLRCASCACCTVCAWLRMVSTLRKLRPGTLSMLLRSRSCSGGQGEERGGAKGKLSACTFPLTGTRADQQHSRAQCSLQIWLTCSSLARTIASMPRSAASSAAASTAAGAAARPAAASPSPPGSSRCRLASRPTCRNVTGTSTTGGLPPAGARRTRRNPRSCKRGLQISALATTWHAGAALHSPPGQAPPAGCVQNGPSCLREEWTHSRRQHGAGSPRTLPLRCPGASPQPPGRSRIGLRALTVRTCPSRQGAE